MEVFLVKNWIPNFYLVLKIYIYWFPLNQFKQSDTIFTVFVTLKIFFGKKKYILNLTLEYKYGIFFSAKREEGEDSKTCQIKTNCMENLRN